MFAKDQRRREELYNCLLNKIRELDRKPSFLEVREDRSMPDPNDFAYYFGSFSRATDEVWKGYNLGKSKHSVAIKKPIKIKEPG